MHVQDITLTLKAVPHCSTHEEQKAETAAASLKKAIYTQYSDGMRSWLDLGVKNKYVNCAALVLLPLGLPKHIDIPNEKKEYWVVVRGGNNFNGLGLFDSEYAAHKALYEACLEEWPDSLEKYVDTTPTDLKELQRRIKLYYDEIEGEEDADVKKIEINTWA